MELRRPPPFDQPGLVVLLKSNTVVGCDGGSGGSEGGEGGEGGSEGGKGGDGGNVGGGGDVGGEGGVNMQIHCVYEEHEP